jgi:acetyltransferase-like isoleucine patch superfamily enzyme
MNFIKIHLYKVNFIVQTILAFPIGLLFILLGNLSKLIDSYSEVSILISKIPFTFGEKCRYLYYRKTLKSLGKNVVFKYGSFCQYPDITIGNRVRIGYYNTLGEVNIGDDVLIGGYVNFISGRKQHSFDDPEQLISTQKSHGRSPINVGSDAWIGSNCVIMADLGSRCVLGAGSVVVKAAESCGVYAGNPAKLIREIPDKK